MSNSTRRNLVEIGSLTKRPTKNLDSQRGGTIYTPSSTWTLRPSVRTPGDEMVDTRDPGLCSINWRGSEPIGYTFHLFTTDRTSNRTLNSVTHGSWVMCQSINHARQQCWGPIGRGTGEADTQSFPRNEGNKRKVNGGGEVGTGSEGFGLRPRG